MSVIYVVEEASASTGPLAAVPGSPFATTTDTVGGLNASTAYFFRITAKDTVLGISAAPTVVGPVVTSASSAVESQQNTRISSASATTVPPVGTITSIGSGSSLSVSWAIPAALYDVGLNDWSLYAGGTSSGVQVARNGTVFQNTRAVQQIVYWNHTVWMQAGSSTPKVTPGSGSFTDQFGNIWSLNASGNPVVNGNIDTASHCQLLEIVNGVVWQEDTTGAWYNLTPTGTITSGSLSWSGPFAAGPTTSAPAWYYYGGDALGGNWIPSGGDPAITTSPQQTDVTDNVATIIGPQLGSWQINSATQVVHSGVADSGSTGTTELLFWSNTIYRQSGGIAPPPPPSSGLSLDPLSASSLLTLTNQNLTVRSGSATPSGVRATAPVDVSKNTRVYFEVTVDAPTEHWACGMCGELFDFTSPTGLGTTGNIIVSNVVPDSFGFFPFSGYEPARIYVNQHQQGASYLVGAGGQNAVASDTIRVVYDPINATFWISSPSMVKDGNVWNNAPLSISNPATGTGGFTCIAGNDLYPAFWTSDSGSQATFNFGASTFANAIPTGCVAYNQAALSNPTPPYTSVPAPAGLVGGTATNTTIQLAWQAPSGGPYTYRVQRLVISGGDNITKLGQIAWTDVGTTSSTSLVATVPSLANSLLNFPFRVQAINGSGTHGLWSQPGPADAAGNGSQSTFLNTPFVSQVGQTTSSVTIALSPQVNTASFPVGVTISYSVYYLPLFGNMDRSPQFVPVPYPAPAPWVLVNDSVSSTNRTTITISGLSSGTQYVVYVFVKDSALSTPPIATYIWVATAPSSGAVLKLLDRNGWLIPSGGIFVDYNTDYHVFMPVGSTTHFAVYYDVNVYNNATLANAVIAQVESVYSFCLTSFGATTSLHTACIESPINADGSKMNIFLTGPGYGGEHLSCVNADIFVGSVPADRGFLDTAMMIVVAEVTEVFMPQLQSLPDCDQHPVGEALSIAMAFSLWPNGILVGQTTANLAAYYLNTKTDADGTANPTSGTARRDWVNSNPAGESLKQFPAIGCAALFMGYLRSQLGFSFTQICTALNGLPVNATCRALYNKLANNTTDPFPTFIALLNAHFPTTSQVDAVHFTQNPFPLS